MKKKSKKLSKISKVAPPGWPNEAEWEKIEREMDSTPWPKSWSPEDGPFAILKTRICLQFNKYRRDEKITQRELAKRLEVTENRISEILHYEHQSYSLERLFEMLLKIIPKAQIDLKIA